MCGFRTCVGRFLAFFTCTSTRLVGYWAQLEAPPVGPETTEKPTALGGDGGLALGLEVASSFATCSGRGSDLALAAKPGLRTGSAPVHVPGHQESASGEDEERNKVHDCLSVVARNISMRLIGHNNNLDRQEISKNHADKIQDIQAAPPPVSAQTQTRGRKQERLRKVTRWGKGLTCGTQHREDDAQCPCSQTWVVEASASPASAALCHSRASLAPVFLPVVLGRGRCRRSTLGMNTLALLLLRLNENCAYTTITFSHDTLYPKNK